MKKLYSFTILLLACTFQLSAQNYPTAPPQAQYQLSETQNRNGTAGLDTCTSDTVRYVRLGKATDFVGVTMNVPSEFAGYAQYYDAPQEITVSGMVFYAGVNSTDPADTAIVRCRIYEAMPDSSLGPVLTEKEVVVYNNYFPSNIDVMKYIVDFDSAAVTTNAYYVSIWSETAEPLGIITDDFNANDGQGEELGWWYWTGDSTWYPSGQFFAWDVDYLLEPIVDYVLMDSVCLSADSICAPDSVCASIWSSPIFQNRMYNQNALSGTPEAGNTFDWGDGSVSTDFDTCHTFTSVGPYHINYTAQITGWTSVCNVTASDSLFASVTPVANYALLDTGLTVYLFNNSVGPVTGTVWDLGDGNTSSAFELNHTYSQPGTYTICLIVTNQCGADTTCTTISVGCPTAGFTSSVNSADASFTNTSVGQSNTYLWDFGDGNTSTDENPTHTYTADSTYYVCLFVTNGCGIDSICDSITICQFPSADWSYFDTGGGIVNFTDQSAGATSWFWEFGDVSNSTSTDQNPTFQYPIQGLLTVCLTVTNGCGTDSMCQTIDVLAWSVEDQVLNNAINMYPNPANDMLSVSFDLGEMTEMSMQITDVAGKIVLEEDMGSISVGTKQVQVSGLAEGLYHVRFITPKGEAVKQLLKVN